MKERKNRSLTLLVVYSILMLSIMGATILVMQKQFSAKTNIEHADEKVPEKYIYVYVEPNEESDTPSIEQELWIVKELEERIAIFSEEGALLSHLEIYTNTLPIADQSLLREGITVTSRSDLYALIEDYSE